MSSTDTLRDRTKKLTGATRGEVHVYLGANDHLYEQVRNRLANVQLPRTLTDLKEQRSAASQRMQSYTPAKLREAVQDRIETARNRRAEFAARGEEITEDWHSAVAVKDATALINTVRHADGAGDLAKSLRSWLADFPVEKPASRPKPGQSKRSASKPAAAKPAARKSSTRSDKVAG